MIEQLKQALMEALMDEYKARATYRLILARFGSIHPFVNIVESEERHIRALVPLFQKYGTFRDQQGKYCPARTTRAPYSRPSSRRRVWIDFSPI